jgi:energy-coupling factor transporter ATP-binding protein EcfA2
MNEKRTLLLPGANGSTESIDTTQSLLFVGANGSGKTRLGAWIELRSPQSQLVHRISAQKSLSMPDSTTPVSIELAEKSLLFGSPSYSHQHKQHRWGGNPATALLSDYEKLMVYLFSDETEENAKFKISYKASAERIDPPITKIDRVKEVWEKILPHRELVIGGLRIQTRVKGQSDKIYNSSEMSDGERVIFYLIGQCLAAPKEGIIVVDEPELHLHKSVQAPLWAEVEKLRPDCLFIYLTHDVDFAASHEGATRIWLKSFDGTSWEWEAVNSDVSLPNELLLEVLGSRKPVVFVEGENGSYDVSLYREILPGFLVVPRGSCSQVIMSVKALKANPQLHHLSVFGIVDRDRRVPAEISSLEADSIYVLSVAEVENLFCTEEVIKLASERLARDPVDDFKKVSDEIFRRLQSELDTQVSLRVASEIQFQLSKFNQNIKGADMLSDAIDALAKGIDAKKLYSETSNAFSQVITSRDFEGLLGLYNRKSLVSQVGAALGLKNGEFPELILRLARGELREEIRTSLKKYFGGFSAHIA